MAVEIKELVFKATINSGEGVAADPKKADPETDPQALVATCVAEVLKILKREKER